MAATSRSALIIYYPIFIGPLFCGLIWGESHPESSSPKFFRARSHLSQRTKVDLSKTAWIREPIEDLDAKN